MPDTNNALINVFISERLISVMDQEWESIKGELIARIEARRAEIIAGCALMLAKELDMNVMGGIMTIRLKVDNLPKQAE